MAGKTLRGKKLPPLGGGPAPDRLGVARRRWYAGKYGAEAVLMTSRQAVVLLMIFE